MKAVMYDTYGSPDVLSLTEVDAPTVGKDELCVKVHASTVTQGDRRVRAADFPGFLSLFGRLATGIFRPRHTIPGTNFAGEVMAVGDDVTRFVKGDRVFGGSMHGAYAEYVSISEESGVAKMPAHLEYEEAADLAYGAGTAVTFLCDKAGVEAGDRVLIVGAAGGVGRYAVSLAVHLGAEVTGVCRGEAADFVRELGADEVIDYETEDFAERGDCWDVVFDTSGTLSFGRCRDSLTDDGRFLSLLITPGLLLQMLGTRIVGGRRAFGGVSLESRELLEEVRQLAEQGAFRPVIDSRYPLDRIRDAHRRLEQGDTRGSVVVTVGD